MSVKEIIKKEIDNLPDNLLTEVFDFIQFLESKRERTLLAKASQELSAASFQKIWDNEEELFMTNYNRGDIVLVPFPFSNQTTTKKRPSVIISSDVYNNTSSDSIIMAITGKIDKVLLDLGKIRNSQ